MISEIEQLQMVLQPSAYWDDDRPGTTRMDITHGVILCVRGEGGRTQWEATWADGSEANSKKPFRTVQEAKADLQKAIKDRIEQLLDEETPPASTSMDM